MYNSTGISGSVLRETICVDPGLCRATLYDTDSAEPKAPVNTTLLS